MNFNIVGNVAQNPIDEIFYENRGRPVTVNTQNNNNILFSDQKLAVITIDQITRTVEERETD